MPCFPFICVFSQISVVADCCANASYAEFMTVDKSVTADLSQLKDFDNGLQLAISIIKLFKKCTLLECSAARRDGRPLEATFRDEFYRASYDVLGDVLLLSEWIGSTGRGMVDFLLPFGRDWGWELIRDGSKTVEHVDRFDPGGNYYQWLQNNEIKEYYILNFCSSDDKKQKTGE
jgi:hypothetical protein